MKITPQILNIPPFISTSWTNIVLLQTIQSEQENYLIVTLQNQAKITIPHLSLDEITQIFEAHAQYNTHSKLVPPKHLPETPFTFSFPLGPCEGGVMDTLDPAMQHNETQRHFPPMPPEVLQKIHLIAQSFGLEYFSRLPPAQENCNCIYCQVIRSMQQVKQPNIELEEAVCDTDLVFKNWDIQQTDDKLYVVTNPLDKQEQYTVYLGDPLGCTCGQKNCEHLKEVLSS